MPKGSRILMADDDKMLIDMYRERLELAGYQVTICRNGEETLAKIREEKPDIILLDIMMPKANGYEVLASLKSDPQTKDIPVVMLSALMRDFNREKAVEAGADDYLIKSEAMPSDVITKIEQVLQKYGKGTTPLPGATPPPAVAPVAPIAPLPEELKKVIVASPSAAKPASPESEKIIFQPAPPTPKKPETSSAGAYIETQPVIEPKPAQPESMPSSQKEKPSVPFGPLNVEEPKKKTSVALIVILTILLTILVNDALMYYFFILKK